GGPETEGLRPSPCYQCSMRPAIIEPRAPTGVAAKPWRLWYDDQCEVCQAGLAWLRWLDGGRGPADPVPLSALLAADGVVPRPPAGAAAPRAAGRGGAAPPPPLRGGARRGGLRAGAAGGAPRAPLPPPPAGVGGRAGRPGPAARPPRLYDWLARHRYSLSRC